MFQYIQCALLKELKGKTMSIRLVKMKPMGNTTSSEEKKKKKKASTEMKQGKLIN
jgi:hypothetical protein